MIVCVCKNISDKAISARVHEGLSFDDIQFELGVATQCGKCEECARNIVNLRHTVEDFDTLRSSAREFSTQCQTACSSGEQKGSLMKQNI